MVKTSKEIYELNNDNTNNIYKLENLNNINVSDIPPHDILCGGFPCQPFSIAGDKKGFEDARSNVFWKIIEILNKHKPSIIILENVKNLTSHDKGNTYKVIESTLKNTGYHIKSKVLDTSKITHIPHHRERIYIIGFLDKNLADAFNFDFPSTTPVTTSTNTNIMDMLENEIPTKYYYTDKLKVYDKVKEAVVKHIDTNTVYQYRRYYVRENKSNENKSKARVLHEAWVSCVFFSSGCRSLHNRIRRGSSR